MPILIIAAHPDDETLGCGGTIARFSKEQEPVHILILGQGITSRQTGDNHTQALEIETLRENGRNAVKILGASHIYFESFADNMFDSVPLLNIVRTIESYIDTIRPSVIFTHHGGDLNIDHSITARAVLTAARPMPGCPVKHLYAFEVLSATDWSFGQISPGFIPHYFISIKGFMEQKIKALKSYEGEIRSFPHPRSAHAVKTLAGLRGSMAGLESAEAFSIIRSITA